MAEKTKIEISLLLPAVPDVRDACVGRLADLLEAKDGIDNAHTLEVSGDQADQLCVHFDPERLSIAEVRELAKRAGAQLHERFGHLLLKSEPMYARRARTLAARVQHITGVLEAEVSPDGMWRIEFDRQATDEQALRGALQQTDTRLAAEEQGVRSPGATAEHDHCSHYGNRTELISAICCGAFMLTGWLLSLLTEVTPSAAWAMYATAYFFGGFFTLREAIESVRAGRFEIDFLMLVAAAGAAALGEWAEGALLLFLFSLGHALEHYAMGRARYAIESLAELAPEFAQVRRDGHLQQVSIDQLRRADIVVIKPHERVPADGFVVQGEGSVNQAPITGESIPADKRPVSDPQSAAENPEQLDAQHRVFAGTINEDGAMEIQVTRPASESTLARVIHMINEAETQKSPTQRFTDKFERIFVPTILGFVTLLLFAWLVIDEPFSRSFYRAMAVLVAASPCALAISTPSAVLSSVARAARGGVLVKGGAPLENLGTLSAIAFDKTGTLTEGKPRLTDVVAADGVAEEELLRVAIAVETLSNHPLAKTVVRDGKARSGTDSISPIPQAHDMHSLTGRGVGAQIDGSPVFIGKEDLFNEIDGARVPASLGKHVKTLEGQGRTTMIVRHGERYLGVLGLMDTPRESAKRTITQLRQLGIQRLIMISGDNRRLAEAVAKEVGIDEAWGDLMPDDKVDAIRKLRKQEAVAMVGDGVNDAPAMANATVGVAMGAASSDVALETADVALMSEDLSHLPFAVGLSRQTSWIIRQNLWFSLAMVSLLVPAILFGLRMGPAVLLHEGSTVLVVFNALRLLAYPKTSQAGRNH